MDFNKTKESLRASARLIPISVTQQQQEEKAREAAEYRAKILQQSKKQDAGDMSPAYNREKASLKKSKKGQRGAKGTKEQKSVDGKATSAQCIFNLANILMVRLMTGYSYKPG